MPWGVQVKLNCLGAAPQSHMEAWTTTVQKALFLRWSWQEPVLQQLRWLSICIWMKTKRLPFFFFLSPLCDFQYNYLYSFKRPCFLNIDDLCSAVETWFWAFISRHLWHNIIHWRSLARGTVSPPAPGRTPLVAVAQYELLGLPFCPDYWNSCKIQYAFSVGWTAPWAEWRDPRQQKK